MPRLSRAGRRFFAKTGPGWGCALKDAGMADNRRHLPDGNQARAKMVDGDGFRRRGQFIVIGDDLAVGMIGEKIH